MITRRKFIEQGLIFAASLQISKGKALSLESEMRQKNGGRTDFHLNPDIDQRFGEKCAESIHEIVTNMYKVPSQSVEEISKKMGYVKCPVFLKQTPQGLAERFFSGQAITIGSLEENVFFLSAYHILKVLCHQPELELDNGSVYKNGKLLAYSTELDICLGIFQGESDNRNPVPFCKDPRNKDVVVLPSSANGKPMLLGQIISQNDSYVVAGVRVVKGHSGSVVISDGAVLGIIIEWVINPDSVHGKATKANKIEELLRNYVAHYER
ncbi:MAG: hypothetical protein V1837_04460 [Candidatus Woesearchaeota archaeon]